MTISFEQLAAFADGELGEFEAAQVRKAVAEDPALAAQLAELESLRKTLSAHFDPILSEPVPVRLSAPIEAADKIVDLSAVREARRRWFQHPVVRYAALPALAASLVLVIFVGRGGEPGPAGYAAAELAAALDGTLSGETAKDGTQMLLSFRDEAGSACRAYANGPSAGIACHDDKGWKLVKSGKAGAKSGSEYQQAGSDNGDIMAQAQEMAAGGAMAPEEEEAARKSGWAAQK